MSDLSNQVRESLSPKKGEGRKKYRELYHKQMAARVAEHEKLAEAFQSTVKTMNGFAQLASQQVQQIASLSKQIADMKTEENGENSEETEVQGE